MRHIMNDPHQNQAPPDEPPFDDLAEDDEEAVGGPALDLIEPDDAAAGSLECTPRTSVRPFLPLSSSVRESTRVSWTMS
jgi:hypothetical protein